MKEGDPQCAYLVGTGIANWSENLENLVWFGMYHGFICLLCVMLIIDETLNIRFGLFSPQWTRAGNGWTIMLCVDYCATFSVLSLTPAWFAPLCLPRQIGALAREC